MAPGAPRPRSYPNIVGRASRGSVHGESRHTRSIGRVSHYTDSAAMGIMPARLHHADQPRRLAAAENRPPRRCGSWRTLGGPSSGSRSGPSAATTEVLAACDGSAGQAERRTRPRW